MDADVLKLHLKSILTPELCLAVYRLKFPYAKKQTPNGAVVGQYQFRPSEDYMQKNYDLIYHNASMPLSKLPLDLLLNFDLTEILPLPTDPEYPELCLGLISTLDQFRILARGYGCRYLRAFFDPICEKLARQFIALPDDVRPDGKPAWLSRGYSVEDWLARTLWFWAPLVHSDNFMTRDRQHLKDWLHSMRAEVESHVSYSDPFAPLEAADDVDIYAFGNIEGEGPPLKSYDDPDKEASMFDYAFWWIRILNSHFAITDMCGHYPYWIEWTGRQLSEKDREYMEKTGFRKISPEDQEIVKLVRQDYLAGVWRALEPVPEFEKGREDAFNARA